MESFIIVDPNHTNQNVFVGTLYKQHHMCTGVQTMYAFSDLSLLPKLHNTCDEVKYIGALVGEIYNRGDGHSHRLNQYYYKHWIDFVV